MSGTQGYQVKGHPILHFDPLNYMYRHPYITMAAITTPTPTSSRHQTSSSTTTNTATEVGSHYGDENSVCSSAMADLNVSMQTATSILSQGVSEMHLDLQSYSK